MFRQMYGGIYDSYKNWPFFVKLKEYINRTWDEYETSGMVRVPDSSKCFHRDKLEDMNPQKLFNYILQNLETSSNSRFIQSIIKILKGKNTKLVLYTYDAFLFDIDNDEEYILDDIKEIFRAHNLEIKYKHGVSYDFE